MRIVRGQIAPTFAVSLVAVFLATGVATISLLATQGFQPVPGVPPDASTWPPHCYRVSWGKVDSLWRPNRGMGLAHLPSLLRLGSNTQLRSNLRGDSWRALIATDPDPDSVTLRSMVQFAGWRGAGKDSIDVLLDAFPMSLRLRFATEGKSIHARTRIAWDTPGTQLAEVLLSRIDCASKVDATSHTQAK
jgi:hypothetical protein